MTVETANRLMQYRKKAGLSQEELADKLGVSRQAVSKWECAESSPDTDNLIALAKIYGVTLDDLLNEDNAEPKKDAKEEKSKGIHIKDDEGNEVHVENVNIHLKDDEGNEVHVGSDGVEIIDNSTGEKIKKNINLHHKDNKGVLESIITSSIGVLCVIAYLLCGFFVKDGWRNYWVLFFLIPLVPSTIEAIKRRRFTAFVYPVLVVAVFLGLGMFIGLWHPTWVLFLTIPVYYTIFGPIDKALKEKREAKGIYIVDNDD